MNWFSTRLLAIPVKPEVLCLSPQKMATCKKRKYEDESRGFRQEWEEKFAFMEKGEKPVFNLQYLIILKSVILNGTMTPFTDTFTTNIRQNHRFVHTK